MPAVFDVNDFKPFCSHVFLPYNRIELIRDKPTITKHRTQKSTPAHPKSPACGVGGNNAH